VHTRGEHLREIKRKKKKEKKKSLINNRMLIVVVGSALQGKSFPFPLLWSIIGKHIPIITSILPLNSN
jgi:tRNA U34 5-carboxymethylaminomethyl modifying GTPase MnmE/TrmE